MALLLSLQPIKGSLKLVLKPDVGVGEAGGDAQRIVSDCQISAIQSLPFSVPTGVALVMSSGLRVTHSARRR